MSKLKRFNRKSVMKCPMVEDPHGGWVQYVDHDRLRTEALGLARMIQESVQSDFRRIGAESSEMEEVLLVQAEYKAAQRFIEEYAHE